MAVEGESFEKILKGLVEKHLDTPNKMIRIYTEYGYVDVAVKDALKTFKQIRKTVRNVRMKDEAEL